MTVCETVKIFSLIELEVGILYTTPHGNSLVRNTRTEALLAEKITLQVDLCDTTVVTSPAARNSFGGEAEYAGPSGTARTSAVIGSALSHVRSLGHAERVDALRSPAHAEPIASK